MPAPAAKVTPADATRAFRDNSGASEISIRRRVDAYVKHKSNADLSDSLTLGELTYAVVSGEGASGGVSALAAISNLFRSTGAYLPVSAQGERLSPERSLSPEDIDDLPDTEWGAVFAGFQGWKTPVDCIKALIEHYAKHPFDLYGSEHTVSSDSYIESSAHGFVACILPSPKQYGASATFGVRLHWHSATHRQPFQKHLVPTRTLGMGALSALGSLIAANHQRRRP